MNQTNVRVEFKQRLVFTLGAIGVTAGITLCSGCVDKPSGCATGTGESTSAAVVTSPKTLTALPEVLLSSRTKDGRYIVVMNFAGSKAMDKAISIEDRRQYVLAQSVALYAQYAKKEKGDQAVRLLALSVPNRDEYARGDFKNMDELAVFDTIHAAATDANKGPAERAGTVEWRKVLSE